MYSQNGRWGGRLTSRPLPESDAQLEALTDAQREELAAIWLARAASERRVADAFQVVSAAFQALKSAAPLQALATRAIDDEYRHAELSRVVASRFAGRKLDEPARLTLVVPEHAGAHPELVHSLHILGHCALNETFASSYLEVSLAYAHSDLGRAAVRELLSDEIDHARLGFAHVAVLGAEQRKEIQPWILSLVRANLRMWRESPRAYSTDPLVHQHGAPPADAVERALLTAIDELMIPGFEQFGFDVTPVRVWLHAGADTA